ncbi:MAG TPA: hypothetical protein VFV99_33615, partial [Kofleriaceae bacterium]|nr:hypothetical protein [Kofleriaceae bacterium]
CDRGGMRWIAWLCLVTSGCSFLFIPRVDPQRPADCNPSRKAVAGDVGAALGELTPFAIFLLFAVDHQTCINGNCHHVEGDPDFVAPATVAGLLITTHLVSAVVGVTRTRECRDLRGRMAPPQPPPYGGPPGAMSY